MAHKGLHVDNRLLGDVSLPIGAAFGSVTDSSQDAGLRDARVVHGIAPHPPEVPELEAI